MKTIGLVDIDTSHPGAWIPILRQLGYTIAGFCDAGRIHPAEAARVFAAEHGVPQFADLPALVEACDIGIIHSCNWERHIPNAALFVTAGKPVFLDKPLAGNLRDLQTLLAWETSGARISGGSCNLYAREIRDYLARTSVADGTRAHTLLGGCGVDEFNYGIHAISAACAVLGFRWRQVRLSAEGRLQVCHVLWDSGDQAVLTFGKHAWLPTHLTLIAERTVEHLRIDIADIFQPLLRATIPYLDSGAPPPIPLTDLVQAEMISLAAQRSSQQNGRWVVRAEMTAAAESYDGAAFERADRKLRYPDADR